MKKYPLKLSVFLSHLEDDEKILDVAHRHFAVFFRECLRPLIFCFLLPEILYFYFPQIYIFALLLFFIGLVWIMYIFLDWFFDAWIITSRGIIDVERHGIFSRNSTRLDFEMLEGTAYDISGFWRTIFNYGDIVLDKLGGQTSLVLKDAQNPKKVETKILKLQEKYVTNKSATDHNALKNMLSQMIAYHVQNGKIDPP